jgi:energy-coupling factor transporter ATP-binding protein EcfA2
MAEMDPFSTFFDNFTKSSKVVVEANEQVFTPEVLAEVARKGLEQHRLIEEKITSLIHLSNKDIDLSEMIATLRNVSMTYLPKA